MSVGLALILIMSSCQNQKTVALKTQLDSLNYAFGVLNGPQVKAYSLQGDTSSKAVEAFIKGFEKGMWCEEPILEVATKVNSLAGVIVPGLGFDQKGKRLGRGKGFYDRFLSEQKQVLKVGVSLEALVVKELPTEEHDVDMDYLVTDKRVRKIGI